MNSRFWYLQILFSSPGDIVTQCAVALSIIEKLNSDLEQSEQMRIDPIAGQSVYPFLTSHNLLAITQLPGNLA